MADRYCGSCGEELELDDRFCAFCGSAVSGGDAKPPQRRHRRVWVTAGLAAVGLITVGVLWLAGVFSSGATTTYLDAEGGSLVAEGMTVSVPEDALDENARVTIRRVDPSVEIAESLGLGSLQTIVAVHGVEIDSELNAPVRLEVALPEEDMSLEVFHEDTDGWEPHPAARGPDRVVTWATRFSRFAVVEADPSSSDPESLRQRISTILGIIERQGVPEYLYDWDGTFTDAVTYQWESWLEFFNVTDTRSVYDSLWWAGFGYQENAVRALGRARQALDADEIDVAYEQYEHGMRYWQYSEDSWAAAQEAYEGNLEAAYEAAEGVKEGTEWALRVGTFGTGLSAAYGLTASTPAGLQFFDTWMIGVNFAEDMYLEGQDEAILNAVSALIIQETLGGFEFTWDGFSDPMTIAQRAGFGFGSSTSNWLRFTERMVGPDTARHVFVVLSETTEWGLVEGGTEMLQTLFGDAVDILVQANDDSGGEPSDDPATTTTDPAEPADTTTTTTAETTTTTQAAPATTAPPSNVGTVAQPIKLLFMPTVNTRDIFDAANSLTRALETSTGLVYELSIPTSIGAAVETMCADPDSTVGFLTGFAYAVGSRTCGIDAAFKTVRFGYGDYWSGIFVPRSSPYDTLDDLAGLSWAVPDRNSTSGYMVPATMFSIAGVNAGSVVEAGGHANAVLSVYNGETGFAAAFYSPPLIEGGEAWEEGDPPDVPDDLVTQCEPTGSGLYCGDYRVLDARASIREEAPDVIQQVRILEISPGVPNDAVAFSPSFPDAVRSQLEAGFVGYDAWNDTFGDVYGWTDLAATSDSEYDFLRALTDLFEVTLDDL